MANHNQTYNVPLAHLLPDRELAAASNISVRNLCLDTRQLKVGDAFIAVIGSKHDGREFIAKAIELGAAVVLVEADKKWKEISWIDAIPVIPVENLNVTISEIAARYFGYFGGGDFSTKTNIIGVTGTNGKTSCTLFIAQLVAALQGKAATIGTLGFGLLNTNAKESIAAQIKSFVSTGLTTPDPIGLQKIIYELVQASAKSIAMEVSSHSLQQSRTSGVAINTAVFTNLTQDHLDYHKDMHTYGNVKALLLQARHLKTVVINIDDAWARSLLTKVPVGIKAITYSTQAQAIEKISPDVYANNIRYLEHGVIATITTPWGKAEIKSPLFGLFNLSNLLAAIASVCNQGFSLAQLAPLIEKLEPAPGRMQSIVVDTAIQDIQVIVDYAHTPDALEKTLGAIRQHTSKRIWTIFGCGGDRDKLKRPFMGKIAERLSDCVIVTNDNPRSEDPASIAADIVREMNRPNGCLVIADRAQAIDLAVQQAATGDTVLIAGKGHEDYQIFATQTLPFSDLKQATLSLEKRIAKYTTGEKVQGARS
jgi:UDP-N-acetylmuramoyl-L-alanyl-D-glutamate--2,6-diaminopimelate ligase